MSDKPIDSLVRAYRYSRPRAKLPRRGKVLFPRGVERKYKSRLQTMARRARELWREMVVPVLAQPRQDAIRFDADVSSLESTLRQWADRVAAIFSENNARQLAEEIATEVDRHNFGQVSKELVKLAPAEPLLFTQPVTEQIRSSIAQNVTLIKDVGDQIRNNVSRTVLDGVLKGQRYEAIIKQVEQGLDGNAGVFKKVSTRAELIARDQVATLNGALTKNRNENLGIELYEWQTAGDARVRDKHVALNGKVFSWSGTVTVDGKTYTEAPGGIFPGSEINCRCVASPVIIEN